MLFWLFSFLETVFLYLQHGFIPFGCRWVHNLLENCCRYYSCYIKGMLTPSLCFILTLYFVLLFVYGHTAGHSCDLHSGSCPAALDYSSQLWQRPGMPCPRTLVRAIFHQLAPWYTLVCLPCPWTCFAVYLPVLRFPFLLCPEFSL